MTKTVRRDIADGSGKRLLGISQKVLSLLFTIKVQQFDSKRVMLERVGCNADGICESLNC